MTGNTNNYGSKRYSRNRFRFLTTKRNAGRYGNRIINVGDAPPPLLEEEVDDSVQTVFVDNSIKSSKYTILTFLPCNLFFQFRRFANFYFLIVALIQLIIDSPVSPLTSISPLVFVVLVTMMKQGYEDYKRHKNDSIINNRPVTRLKHGIVQRIPSSKIEVGDVLQIHEGDDFPADLILLSSSDPRGRAYIMTANLDGETNLKTVLSPKPTQNLKKAEDLSDFSCRIECENPNSDLQKFVGRILVPGNTKEPLSQENLLLRGTSLKHTAYVFGCVVYTGQDTKMSKNSKMTPIKFSTVELSLNRYLLFFVVLLLAEVFLASILRFTQGLDLELVGPVPWYLGPSVVVNIYQVIQDSLSFLVLFNYVVPISLYVTLEFQKFVGSFFLLWDEKLIDPDTGNPPICNSSDLNEELGQVEYLFSDKTGTLTENVMLFKECSIDGLRFADSATSLLSLNETKSSEKSINHFLQSLALCHTVEVSINDSDLHYEASSPDEKALVDICRKYGTTFMGTFDTGDEQSEEEILQLVIKDRPKEQLFKRMRILEFDSDRKCMSVIVQDEEGNIRLICKGAESSVLPNCISGEIEITKEHVDIYGTVGLRTLVVCEKQLTESELDQYLVKLKEASISLVNRSEKLKDVYREIEKDLHVLGAVAIEDKLQDGVKETLIRLGQAGIKIWILTGDKRETALNISQSCGHYDPSTMHLLDLCKEGSQVSDAITDYLYKTRVGDDRNCLVIDGKAVRSLFAFKDTIEPFLNLALRCRSVICCRMSPLQKAEIVKLIKNSPESPITASIGDGGNDVSMIQEAHVGFGIMGKEGRAAVRSSDFAFGKFRHLQRVLLVHGHWYYVRVAILVHYFFYKNVVGFTPQLIYAFFNNFSAQTLYNGVNLTLYNIVFTSLPIFVYGLIEQNISADDLLQRPDLYKKIANNALLDFKNFIIWFSAGVWHAIVIFFGFYLLCEDVDLSRVSFGLGIYQTSLIVVSVRLLVQSRYWNMYLIGSVFVSLAGFVIFTFIFHSLRIPSSFYGIVTDYWLPVDRLTYWEIYILMSRYQIWFGWLLLVVVCISLDLFVLTSKKSAKDFETVFKMLKSKFGKKSFDLNSQRWEDTTAFTNMAFVISREDIKH
ncbi:phospholipid-transporting ATPase IF [Lepeophtheirus salmonis]|uniref:phospholipid-transporting ATPase IF n=1 Tax=Lepeophtheirus salmonis TaxID=72036 RepID=UPI001AE90991|nr:probable phospholipid-transporting ATPase IF [Lepeophtheirus salmonis]